MYNIFICRESLMFSILDISNASYSSSPMKRSFSSLSVRSDANSSCTVVACNAVRAANVTPGQLLELGL